MDPTDQDQLKQALASQGVLVGQHDRALREVTERLLELSANVAQLGNQLSQLSVQLTAPQPQPQPQASAPPAQPPLNFSPREPHIPSPERYSGDLGSCGRFLLQCALVFDLQPTTYATDKSRIAFLLSLLSGKASQWATAVWESNSAILHSYKDFTEEMKRIFDHPLKGKEAAKRLFSLNQGSLSVAHFLLLCPSQLVLLYFPALPTTCLLKNLCNWAAPTSLLLNASAVKDLVCACTVVKMDTLSAPAHYDQKKRLISFVIEQGQLKADPEKLKAVAEWPTPESRKQLQRFLGFANFYRRFIKDYSRKAAPLTRLTSTSIPFKWSTEAETAFTTLKRLFISAPVLSHPDPSRQFVVEVDASDSGIGAVLSQRSPEDNKMHPCAFFSRKLSPAERNYDIGNRELLAVVLALKEWRHWLEGAEHPFIVWTDHKNLSYLHSAKRLNSVKLDGRCSWEAADDSQSKPELILSSSNLDENPNCLMGAVHWEIERIVREAQRTQPDPGYHPQSNGQTERANQDLESALRCVTSRHPSSWSSHLPWIEYAHNSLTTSATGMSPFMVSLGYQPPLFPAQEQEVAVPSVQVHMRRCRSIWRTARAALLRTVLATNRWLTSTDAKHLHINLGRECGFHPVTFLFR
ncbi:hypothetical protein WMY93_030421 [Mugilogobius chulae]|uniref:Integrase catalytic domain-containing protein n=1 Tax=Mugilogobius chulae TaxID=88201 RepID=A0AAW0MFE7_9GOBI